MCITPYLVGEKAIGTMPKDRVSSANNVSEIKKSLFLKKK